MLQDDSFAEIDAEALYVHNILKEVDINCFFKVLAKFSDYKHNKDKKEAA